MNVRIHAGHIALTPAIQERIGWICTLLERAADPRDLLRLSCDITLTKISRGAARGRFRATIYFAGAGEPLTATGVGETPETALDGAHDTIERHFSLVRRGELGTRRITDFARRQNIARRAVERAKELARKKAPSWRVTKRRRFGDEEQ